jgi:hypothetical protein
MRVAVDHRRVAEGVPPGLEHGHGQPVADLPSGLSEVQDLLALEPAERQEALGGELGLDAGHAHLVDGPEGVGVERHMLRLALVVELLAHPLADLLGDLAGVDGGIEPAVDREGHLELAQIRLHGGLHVGYWSLQASGVPSWWWRRWTLAQGRGSAGLRSKEPKRSCQPRPSSACMRRFTKAAPMGGASDWSFWSSAAYSGGSRSGIVARS